MNKTEKNTAGVDEAGRGPLAGPVVAAAVILPKNHTIVGLIDSKKLTAKKREKLYNEIIKVSDYGIGIVSHRTIDKINILQATFKAMRKAILNLDQKPDKTLIDGYGLPDQTIKNEGIIGGDNLIESISAASILAKVTRDRLMINIDKIFPEYGFANHKGYGTEMHMQMLKINKSSPIHRKSFRPIKENLPTIEWLNNNNRFNSLGIQLACLNYLNQGYSILEINFKIKIYHIKVIKDDVIVFIKVLVNKNENEKNKILNLNKNDINMLKDEVINYSEDFSKTVNSKFEILFITLNKNPTFKAINLNNVNDELSSL
jgi:ribonuclease HII/Holliday junction resolvase-like predicted endonuclease